MSGRIHHLLETIRTTDGRSTWLDERAVSATLGYALTLGVTTLLITGLIFAVGTEVENRRESAIDTEMEVVGNQLAASLTSADRLADAAGENGLVVLHRSFPTDVAGTPYTIEIIEQAPGDYDLRLTSTNPQQTVEVSVVMNNTLETGEIASGPLTIAYNTVTDTVEVHREDGREFDESGGQVVMEAESLTGLRSGLGPESDHRWYAFDDTSASGDVAVTTAPNVSSGDGTVGHTGDHQNGTRLDYTVDFETTGTYYVYVRMRASPTETGDSDSIHVGIDGKQPVTYGGDGLGEGVGSGSWTWAHGVTNDGTPDDYRAITVSSPGEHTINLYMREDGTQVDKIVLTKTTDPAADEPTGEGPEEST